MSLPKVVAREEWLAARKALLAEEKDLTRQRDSLMFDPEWEDGCQSCRAGTDELSSGFVEHLHTRDTSYAMVSRAPLAKLDRWTAKKGWDVSWSSSFGTDFNYDFGVTIDESI